MSFVVLLPLLLPFGVAVTRIHDYKHHFIDVVGGFIVGSLMATLVFARITLTLSDLIAKMSPSAGGTAPVASAGTSGPSSSVVVVPDSV